MMPEQYITCPYCGKQIQLTEALTSDIQKKLREQYDGDLRKRDEELRKALLAQKNEYEERIMRERAQLERQAKKTAEESISVELKDLKIQLEEKSKQLEVSRKQELDLLKRKRELEEKERDLRLEVERKMDAERGEIWEKATKKASEDQHLKELEKDKQLADMRKQIDELKRKAEMTSQQAQGEVQELALEGMLKSKYAFDIIEAVGKGVRGADVIHTVKDKSGVVCGKILYESKRTKYFSEEWISKLKADALAEKADICVIATEAMPEGTDKIGQKEGVWICRFNDIMGLSMVLRESLIQIHSVSTSQSNRGEKMQMLYDFLTGNEFRMQLDAIIEGFKALQDSYQDEKLKMQKIWKEREKQLEKVLLNTVHFYGSIRGIAGNSIPEIKLLEGGAEDLLPL